MLSKLTAIFEHAFDNFYDFYHDIDTRGYISPTDLKINPVEYHGYAPVSRSDFLLLLKRSAIMPGDVFLDVGSGKGFALILAMLFPFQKVIGIEISDRLCETARNNVLKFMNKRKRSIKCKDFEIINMKIEDYSIPSTVNYIFLFNPFEEITIKVLVSKIAESINIIPRRITILYSAPTFKDEFLKLNGAHKLDLVPVEIESAFAAFRVYV